MSTPLQYRVVEGWLKLPPGCGFREVASVAVGSGDRVYLLTRVPERVLVCDREGSLVASWGEGIFGPKPHGIAIGPDDSVYCVDASDHTVRKFTSDGRPLMTLGTPGVESGTGYTEAGAASCNRFELITRLVETITRGGPPFNRPANLSVAPSGDLYVADGYGNARVHRFSSQGELIQSWGEPGTGPGQFKLCHGVCVTADERVLVADRENDRIQIFTPDGVYRGQWTHVQRPSQMTVDRDGLIYVAELPWFHSQYSYAHGRMAADLPGRVSVLDGDGRVLARWGGPDFAAPGNFGAPHIACADSRGNLYVAEVTYTFTGVGAAGLVPPGCHMFQKFARG
jgi:DNA-binding beta-propeller fold protein YncE